MRCLKCNIELSNEYEIKFCPFCGHDLCDNFSLPENAVIPGEADFISQNENNEDFAYGDREQKACDEEFSRKTHVRDTTQIPHHNYRPATSEPPRNYEDSYTPPKKRTFSDMWDDYEKFWHQYVDFKGRSTASEFWTAVLFNLFFSVVISLLGSGDGYLGHFMTVAFGLATFIPHLCLCLRRLNDIGKSRWLLLLFFAVLVGWIILIILLSQPTKKNEI